MYTSPRQMNPVGYQQISATTASAQSITASELENSNYVLLIAESNNIRFRVDGTDPTPSVGALLLATQSIALPVNPTTVRIISTSGTAVVSALMFGS